METNDTDKLLKRFFEENKRDIADYGFTRRVMAKLPEQTNYEWIVWMFAVAGTALTMFLGIQNGLFAELWTKLIHMPFYVLPGIIFSFPLLFMLGIVLSKKKCCSLV